MKQDWFDRLSLAAKAEILGGILHQLVDHMPKQWRRMPPKWRKLARRAQSDCSVWHADLTKKDIRNIGDWFKEGQ